MDAQSLYQTAAQLRENLNRVIRGKDEIVEFVLAAVLAGGNVLLEDVPGVGKTTLAKALAKSLNAAYNRIQFTPDLLPADILGSSVFNPQTAEFSFRRGPIFANILLADEINRASPRTQSALLEAMTEQQATIDGVRHQLAAPFIVIATQNPIEYHGTYPLPEAQLDRFALCLALGYPDPETEAEILYRHREQDTLADIQAVADGAKLVAMQSQVRTVGVEASIATYIVSLVNATRQETRLQLGASPRASLTLFRAAQSLAFLRRRDFVIPDDVRDLTIAVLSHRIVVDAKAKYSGADKAGIIRDIVDSVAVPV